MLIYCSLCEWGFIPLYRPEGMTSLGGSDGGRLDHQELFQSRAALAGSGSPLA